MKTFQNIFKSTIFRYAVAGSTASLVDIILFNMLVYLNGTYYITAVIISNTVSFFVRFFLQKKAFRATLQTGAHSQLFLYGILFGIGVGMTALFMYIFVDIAHIHQSLSQIITILLVAAFCFLVYRHIIFPDAGENNAGSMAKKVKKILVLTQKADKDDPVMGFFHRWIIEFSRHYESVVVICLEKGNYDFPPHVKVCSLGKEERQSRLQYLIHFYWYIITERKNYDAVFVHMNQEYVILGYAFWKLLGKKIYMWRNHVHGTLRTKLAILMSTRVFCTSSFSYTAKYKKTIIMPVGIDTDMFERKQGIKKISRSILFLGRIAPIKKPDFLLVALQQMKKKAVNFTASFYGEPSPKDVAYYEGLKEKTREYGLSGNVVWQPAISNDFTVKIYNMHEICVNLSPDGLYDKTIFEAMATETLMMASNNNLREIIQEDFIFEEGNAAELAHRLTKLLDLSEEYKKEYGKKLRNVVIEKHSLKKLFDKLTVVMSLS